MKRSRLGMSVKNLERGGGTMRKILLVTLVAGLLMSLVSLAWATQYPISSGTETQVWKWVVGENGQGSWVPQTGVGADARAWHQGTTQEDNCNKEKWEIDVASHASVAQWIHWMLSSKGWQIRVRKPGIYIADCISATIDSNADVLVTFAGFDDLRKLSDPMKDLAIETWYALGDTNIPADSAWVKATDLNSKTLRVPYCYHDAHLWIKINVRGADDSGYLKTRASEYQNDATICLSVSVLKNWIDPTTGNFLDPQPGQSSSVYNYDGPVVAGK